MSILDSPFLVQLGRTGQPRGRLSRDDQLPDSPQSRLQESQGGAVNHQQRQLLDKRPVRLKGSARL